MMDCESFWEGIKKYCEKYDNLPPKEKLIYRIGTLLERLNIRGRQSIRDAEGKYLGEMHVIQDYEMEEILGVLDEAKRIIIAESNLKDSKESKELKENSIIKKKIESQVKKEDNIN